MSQFEIMKHSFHIYTAFSIKFHHSWQLVYWYIKQKSFNRIIYFISIISVHFSEKWPFVLNPNTINEIQNIIYQIFMCNTVGFYGKPWTMKQRADLFPR